MLLKLIHRSDKSFGLALLVFALPLFAIGCPKQESTSTKVEVMLPPKVEQDIAPPVSSPVGKAVEYKVVSSEDIGGKAMGDRLLSSFTLAELEALPDYKKIRSTVVVPPSIKEVDVEPTVDTIIKKMTKDDNDIDEIILFLYSDEGLISGPYDVATAIWALRGELGHVDAEIASGNSREGYLTTIEVLEGFESILSERNVPETKFGLTKETRKQIYYELVSAMDRATADADRHCPIDPSSGPGWEEKYKRNSEMEEQLTNQYRKEVLDKFKITEETALGIETEGMEELWPLP